MDHREVMQQALDAIGSAYREHFVHTHGSTRNELQGAANAIRAELAKPAVVPNGWVMVPKEPTAEMIRANGQSGFDVGDKWLAEDAKQTWVAMLAAAPQPPAPSVPSVDVEAVWERIESLEYAEKWLDVFSKEAWSAAQAGKITSHRESLSTLRLELAHAIGDEK